MMTTLSTPRPSRFAGRQGATAVDNNRASPATVAGSFALRNRNLAFLVRRDEHASDHGVQLPLLAPMLAGLRLRSGPSGTEFILPNPSGGRGVYVTSWPVVTGFATPSLHDTLLIGRLSGQKRIDPQIVRDAARWVAREGHAGLEAADAAREADEALRTAALRLGGQLLMALAKRAGFTRPEEAARCLSRVGFYQLAGRLGWHGPDLAEALRVVSAQYATVATGIMPDAAAGMPEEWGGGLSRAGAGRWGRLEALLRRLRAALAEEQSNGHGTDGAALGRIIAAADQCLASVDRLLPKIDSLQTNPMPLLEACRDGQAQDWLDELDAALDGWARVCLLWFDADTKLHRQSVITEMAVLTRTVGNAETRLQMDLTGDPATRVRLLLARNERLRARELLLDVGSA